MCIQVSVGRTLNRSRHRWKGYIKMEVKEISLENFDYIDLSQENDC